MWTCVIIMHLVLLHSFCSDWRSHVKHYSYLVFKWMNLIIWTHRRTNSRLFLLNFSDWLMRLSRIRDSHDKRRSPPHKEQPRRTDLLVQSGQSAASSHLSSLIHTRLWSWAKCYKGAGGGWRSKGRPLCRQHLLLSWNRLADRCCTVSEFAECSKLCTLSTDCLTKGQRSMLRESTYRKCDSTHVSRQVQSSSTIYSTCKHQQNIIIM